MSPSATVPDTGRRLSAGEYGYGDLQPGDRYDTQAITLTESHIVAFAGITGDFFDVHMDDTFARQQGFPGRIAHGLLGLALIDGLKTRSAVRHRDPGLELVILRAAAAGRSHLCRNYRGEQAADQAGR